MKPAQKRKSVRAKKEEPIDISTFKAWLQGVEDMQDEGWTPSDEQWIRIRAKIESIVEYIEEPEQRPMGPMYRNTTFSPNDQYVQPMMPVQHYPVMPNSLPDIKPSDNLIGADGAYETTFV